MANNDHRVFNSFAEFAAFKGLRPKERKDKPFYCRKCGKEMRKIPGTNVALCENAKDGVVCGNRVLLRTVF